VKPQTENNQCANNLVSTVKRQISIDYRNIHFETYKCITNVICISLKYKNIKYSSQISLDFIFEYFKLKLKWFIRWFIYIVGNQVNSRYVKENCSWSKHIVFILFVLLLLKVDNRLKYLWKMYSTLQWNLNKIGYLSAYINVITFGNLIRY